MKTFKDKYKELVLWHMKELQKIDDMNIPWEGGHDGKEEALRREVFAEYLTRLKALKKKYNKDQPPTWQFAQLVFSGERYIR